MKKVTKRLLVACVAALAVGACQDSVQVVTPEPPPPPPPPPAVDATVTIQGLRTIPGNAPVNPTNVSGDINVVLNVEEGDNEVTQIDLLLDGTAIGCTAISTNRVPGEGVRLSQAAADEVECFFNTDDVVGECVGDQLDPAFTNGTHTLGAQVTLADGTTRTASNTQEITLVNANFIMLAHIPGITVISKGVNYYGGPFDTDGDAADDNVNQIAACPVAYTGTVVDELSLIATTGGPQALDLGSGPGVAVTLNPPFIVTLDPDDNAGVEDDANLGLGTGSVVSTTGAILDEDGLNVTAQFPGVMTAVTFFDYTAPVVNSGGASEVTIDGASFVASSWYSEGDLGLSFVLEDGVGFSFAAGAQVDVGDCATADNSDADPSTDFDPELTGVQTIADHPEDDWELGGDGFAGADGGGLDCYLAELQALSDDLFNATDLSVLVTTIQSLVAYGSDQTEPAESALQPDADVILNPDANANGYVCADAGDCTVMYEATDPDLASGDPGSGVDGASATAVDEDDAALAVVFTAPDMFAVDISGLGDGAHTVSNTVPDFATPANERDFDIVFTLDDTAPVFGALNPAPVGSAGTDAQAIVITIGGTISDAHIIDDAVLSVDYAANAVCNDGDDVPLLVPSEIDRNGIDLTNGTDEIAFNESFTIQRPLAGTFFYCFTITAEDEAVLKDGTDQGNVSALTTLVTVVFN